MALDAFALILTMLALGMLLARFRVLPETAGETLNQVVVYVCLPAAVLIYAPRLRLDLALLGLAVTPWLLALATLLLLWPLSRWMRLRRDQYAALLLCAVLGNTSFIGYPLVRALMGEQAVPYAVGYDQFGCFLLLSTFGLYVLARYGGDTPPTARAVAARIAGFPPLWALLLGLSVMPESPPAWVGSMLQRLADAMLPLAMLAVGLSIRLRLPRDELGPLALGVSLKLVLLPALALPLGLALGLRGDMLKVSVLESAMPTMVTAAALVISHRLAPRLAAGMVAYGLLLSLATLPAWVAVLERLPLD